MYMCTYVHMYVCTYVCNMYMCVHVYVCVCVHMCFQTETKIMIRGKGSVKENKFGKGAQPMPGEDESLHALVIASSPEALKKGVDKVRTHAHTHTPHTQPRGTR